MNKIESPKMQDRVTAFETAIADTTTPFAVRAEIGRARETYRAHYRFFENDANSCHAVSEQWLRDSRRGLIGYTFAGAEAIIAICASAYRA
jgi:hypothetical protein